MRPMPATTPKPGALTPEDVAAAARRAVDVASDKQASDVLLLDIRDVTTFADYMVIMSANTPRQINALAEELTTAAKESGLSLHHREGTPSSGWLLLDFADVIVHVFDQTQRDYYRLEQVWRTARTVVRIQ